MKSKSLTGKVSAFKTFYNKHDGHTYWMDGATLMSCPTNANGTLDKENLFDVMEDYVNKLSAKELEYIAKGLGQI